MVLKRILLMFVVTLLTSSSYSSPKEQLAYIPIIVLNKNTISGLEITERNSSSPSTGIFIFYQIYKPSSIVNEFNGTQITHTLWKQSIKNIVM